MKCAEETGGKRIRSCLYCYYMMTEQMDKVNDLVQVLSLVVMICAHVYPIYCYALHTVHCCSLLLQMSHVLWSVCLFV